MNLAMNSKRKRVQGKRIMKIMLLMKVKSLLTKSRSLWFEQFFLLLTTNCNWNYTSFLCQIHNLLYILSIFLIIFPNQNRHTGHNFHLCICKLWFKTCLKQFFTFNLANSEQQMKNKVHFYPQSQLFKDSKSKFDYMSSY